MSWVTPARALCIALLTLLPYSQVNAQANAQTNTQVDGELKEGEGVTLVRAHCSACHSLSLVTSQRGDRDYWLYLIRWMQKTQNLWAIPESQESVILDYLAKHYDETEWGRRPPLPVDLRGPLR